MEKSINLKFKKFGEYIAKFPLAGEAISIQSLKNALTEGLYGTMTRSGLKADEEILDMVDAFSVFTILIPELKKELPATYTKLDQFVARDIVRVYTKQYLPWYNDVMTDLKKLDDEDAQ